ncbi:MAG: response regulator [Eubacterium sp.]|nr:response regulator [Eubacterium sp.]
MTLFQVVLLIGCMADFFATQLVLSRTACQNQKWLSMVGGAVTACSLLYIVQLSLTDIEAMESLYTIIFMMKIVTVVFYILFVLSYLEILHSKKWLRAMVVISTILWIAASTNRNTHLLFHVEEVETCSFGSHLILDYHTGYYSIVSVLIIMVVIAFIQLWKKASNSHGVIRRKSIWINIASAIAIWGFVVHLLVTKDHADTVVLGYACAFVIFAGLTLKYGLTNPKDVAANAVVESNDIGVVVMDMDNGLVFVSDGIQMIFKDIEWEDEVTQEKLHEIIEQSESMHSYEGRDYTVKAIDLRDGVISVGKMLRVTDVTNVTNQVDEIIRLKSEAEAANRAKSAFLADMSHEIRTPMNAIIGFSELLKEEENEETRREYTDNITHAGDVLLTLINRILDISKIEAGRLEVKPKNYSVSELLNTISNIIGYAAAKKDLDFACETKGMMPSYLYGASDLIYEILINLLNNAVKYTQVGSVSLMAEFAYEDERIGYLTLTINDTGSGMSEEFVAHIFEKFTRAKSETVTQIEGSGLGMSIVKEYVEALDGDIQIQSKLGEGTKIIVKLPQEVATERSYFVKRDEPEIMRDFVCESAHVLVVDDNEMNLKVASSTLKKYKMKVDTAMSGQESLEKMEKTRYDIVFMDQMMPGMDGTRTLQKARQIEGYDKVPVVMLTANAIIGTEDEAMRHDFNGYLTKPMDREKLHKCLETHIPSDKIHYIDRAKIRKERRAEQKHLEKYKVLDTDYGIAQCGDSLDDYMEILRFFLEIKDARIREVNELFDNGDWDNYTINVHGLKSSTRNIGGAKTGEIAFSLENAGKSKNIDFIKSNHEILITNMKELVVAINEFISEQERENESVEEVKEEISEELYESVVQSIREAGENFEFEQALLMIKALYEFHLPVQKVTLLEELEQALGSGDYDNILELSAKL